MNFLGESSEKVVCHKGDVFFSLPQRRYMNGDDVQTIEQILPKSLLSDDLFQILIAR